MGTEQATVCEEGAVVRVVYITKGQALIVKDKLHPRVCYALVSLQLVIPETKPRDD